MLSITFTIFANSSLPFSDLASTVGWRSTWAFIHTNVIHIFDKWSQMSTSDLVVGLLCIYCAWIVHELCSGLALIRSFLFWKFWLRKRTGCFGSTGQSHWSLSISPRGLEARFLFLMHTHTCIWTPKASHTQRHMYSVRWPSITQPGDCATGQWKHIC